MTSKTQPSSSIPSLELSALPEEKPTMSQAAREYVADFFKTKLEKKPHSFKWEKVSLQALSFVGFSLSGVEAILGIVRFAISHSIPAVILASMVCAILGGVVSCIMGCSSLVEGVQTVCKGEHLKGSLLILQGLLMTAIGVIMIAGPLLLKFAAGAGITAVITNPIVLPLLSIAVSCVILCLVIQKIGPIWMGKDLGTQVIQQLNKTTDEEIINNLLQFSLPDEITIDEKKEVVDFKTLNHWIEKGDNEKVNKVLKESTRYLKQNVGRKNSRAILKMILELVLLEQMEKIVSEKKGNLSEENISNLEQLITEVERTGTIKEIAQKVLASFNQPAETTSPPLKRRKIVSVNSTDQDPVYQFVTEKLKLQAQHTNIEEQKQKLSTSIKVWQVIEFLTPATLILNMGANGAVIGSYSSTTNSYQIANALFTLGNAMSVFQYMKNKIEDYTQLQFQRNVTSV